MAQNAAMQQIADTQTEPGQLCDPRGDWPRGLQNESRSGNNKAVATKAWHPSQALAS